MRRLQEIAVLPHVASFSVIEFRRRLLEIKSAAGCLPGKNEESLLIVGGYLIKVIGFRFCLLHFASFFVLLL